MLKIKASAWDKRDNNFDFIRLALAVLVIYSHAYPLGTGTEQWEPLMRLTHGQMTFGAVAVDVFFIMSGFLITASAERSRSVFAFMKKRVSRIYPAFIVASLLTVFIVAPLASTHFGYESIPARVLDFLLQTARLREFSYTSAFTGNPYPNAINGSAWSIQFEFWCYIGVALLLSLGLLRKRRTLLLLFLATLALSVVVSWKGLEPDGGFAASVFGSFTLWTRLLPLYLAGVVFYLFRERILFSGWLAAASLIALCIAARVPHGCAALFPIAGTYLAFFVAFTPALRLHSFGRFGDFSYGAYLYAFPIEQLLMSAFGHPMAPWRLFICAAPLTLVIAVASWYGIERHFLRPGRRKETVVHALELEQQSA